MARLVLKFGGTSVADLERIERVARHVKREVDAGHEVAVVVSAMAGQTNKLVNWCRTIAPMHDAREYDTVVASGEQVTSGLLALQLQSLGVDARSWQGWQIAVKTDAAHGAARIIDIEGDRLIDRLERGQVAVVAGFQGIGPDNRIATLGRGGSDTSAVAIAAAIKADRCDIYTDVDGVYTTDPRIVPKARRLERISFEEMLEMASLGAKVLQVRSVELAQSKGVRVFVRSSFEDPEGIADTNKPYGTLICNEDEILEQPKVAGITLSRDDAQISLRKLSDKPGVAASVFVSLADAGINVDMIVQTISSDGSNADITFTVPQGEYQRSIDLLQAKNAEIGFETMEGETDVVKISVVGIGMRSHAGIAAKCFQSLAERNINILAITTSEIKISVLIEAEYAELAVRSLHAAYRLEAEG